jgi:hypothetical protein
LKKGKSQRRKKAGRRETTHQTARRMAVREILARSDVDLETAKIVEDTSINFERALKNLADR